MDVTLDPIPRAGAPVLGRLFELYAHDFSEFVPLPLKPTGLFDVAPGDIWWTHADHHPLYIHAGGALAGFALARRGSRTTGAADVMDVAEFFVVRGARRHGVGLQAAHALFGRFPGPWEVRVRQKNAPARGFWTRAVGAFTRAPAVPEAVTSGGAEWDVFRFVSA